MKQGGVGYVIPDRGSFPKQADTNRFILEVGGLPTHTWLDGASEGEQRLAEVLEVSMSTGVVALNVIPDRNYGANAARRSWRISMKPWKSRASLDLLLVAGTEMNSPGQKFVDDWAFPELARLAPFLPPFCLRDLRPLRAPAHVRVWATRASGRRRTSLPRRARNEFFSAFGRRLRVAQEDWLTEATPEVAPDTSDDDGR